MKRFIGFRPNPPEKYYEQGAANAPDEPQYEGVLFEDGTVAIRWLTKYRSHSIWASFDDFYQIHGHPEYGTAIKWLDGEIPIPIPKTSFYPLPSDLTYTIKKIEFLSPPEPPQKKGRKKSKKG